MPSFQDSAVIFFLALLLFGPKKLPELARQLGKLMAEFRRASNEFRMQMDEELRIADQEEQRKKIAAMEAAAPVTPPVEEPASETPAAVSENSIAQPAVEAVSDVTPERIEQLTKELVEEEKPLQAPDLESLPIASSGNLNMMPPSTGLPVSNSTLSPVLDSIPHASDSNDSGTAPIQSSAQNSATEAHQHG